MRFPTPFMTRDIVIDVVNSEGEVLTDVTVTTWDSKPPVTTVANIVGLGFKRVKYNDEQGVYVADCL